MTVITVQAADALHHNSVSYRMNGERPAVFCRSFTDRRVMNIALELGGIVFEICSERELAISENLSPFLCEKKLQPEIQIQITWDWEHAHHPSTEPIGEDLLQEYYKEGIFWFCESKGGKAPVTCTCYREDFRWMQCAINEKPFLEPPDTLEKILRLLPMRAVFVHFRTLFLHASQAALNGTGIVFAAPSGTGKTTQAKLWRDHMNAKFVCNDRTLLRNKDGVWYTYGYPIDGSEPVRSNMVNRLGCIVLLKQGNHNFVTRLRPGRAVRLLMEQMVLDCWNVEAKMEITGILLELFEKIPVYEQVCTPEFEAVEELKRQLIQDEVIKDGTDSEKSLG